jgi:CRP/FNR family transcriptional regulator, cyclic AMP receptor protein
MLLPVQTAVCRTGDATRPRNVACLTACSRTGPLRLRYERATGARPGYKAVITTALIRIFEREPDFIDRLPRREAATATEVAVARMIDLERGEWRPPLIRLSRSDLGLLILRGLIVRRTEVAGRAGIELLGTGDVATAWIADADPLVPASVRVRVSAPTTVAILDRRFVETISRWPEIVGRILERMSTRAASLSFQLAIARISTLEQRLLCLLWHLAERWGHVSRDGIELHLPLTQDLLADLTSASRPSVSAALGRLRAQGLVERYESRQYRLLGDPPAQLYDVPQSRRLPLGQELERLEVARAHRAEVAAVERDDDRCVEPLGQRDY